MLESLTEEIRLCYQKAEACARQAETASNGAGRADFLRLEQGWLELARSYELGQRLTLFINESRKSNMLEIRGAAHVGAERLGAEALETKLPALGQTNNDPQPLQNEMIAIVDDDEYARAGLGALLESVGGRVATFASAEEYLASDMEEDASYLILDVHLPGMSGPDLHDHLVASARCPSTVFVTGRFQDHVQKRVIDAGALGYLIKPCDVEALLDCMTESRCPKV